jgi:hypothetical protein
MSLIESAQSWWWGNLALARERDYGSLKELAERLNINYHSLHNYQTVAKAYPTLDMRMSSVSFNHHQIAAPLEDRLEWLKGIYTCQHVKIIGSPKKSPVASDRSPASGGRRRNAFK